MSDVALSSIELGRSMGRQRNSSVGKSGTEVLSGCGTSDANDSVQISGARRS